MQETQTISCPVVGRENNVSSGGLPVPHGIGAASVANCEQNPAAAGDLSSLRWKTRHLEYLNCWFIEPEGGGEAVCIIDQTKTERTTHADGSYTTRTVPIPNADDIARLIAAAPELYEACRKALSCASMDTSVRALIRGAVLKVRGIASEEAAA